MHEEEKNDVSHAPVKSRSASAKPTTRYEPDGWIATQNGVSSNCFRTITFCSS